MFLPDFLKKTIFLILLIYSIYSIGSTFWSIHTNVIEKDKEYQDKILGLKDERNKLQEKLNSINTDEFVEKEARTRLNMRKEGEEVFLITSNEAEKSEVVSYTETTDRFKKTRSNFDKWMELLF
jgi:cell division protein FtsB